MTNQANKQSGLLRRFGLTGAVIVAACLAAGATFLGYGVDANLPWPVTSNTTIAAKHCGGTVLAGTGSTGQFTLTLPAVTGFPSNCSVLIKNGDSTNAKFLSGFPSDLFSELFPGQSVGVKIVNGAWRSFYNPGLWVVTASVTLYANGNSVATNATTSTGNNTLHFAATPSWITTGVQIADVTTPAAIPSGTTVLSTTGTTAVLSANVASAGVGNGDAISASAPCGSTGALTCAPGSDANDCFQPSTACLTAQRPLNLFLNHIHSGGFGNAINYAHASSLNYALNCEGGPFLGTSVIAINGDVNASTAVTVVTPPGGNGVAFKDGCTLAYNNVAFADNASHNGLAFINGGAGQYGHVDLNNVSFGALTSGIAINSTYGSSVTFDGPCSVTGNMVVFMYIAAGGVVDFSGQQCTGSSGLTFSVAFAIITTGSIVNGVQPLSAGSPTFPGFSGVSGPRCQIDQSFILPNLQNPNAQFPGSSDCVPISFVGAVGVPSGTGAAASYTYGSAGQALCSQGGGGATPNNYCNPIPANPSASTLGGIESIAAIAHQWIDSISTSGVPHQSQPATSDLSDVTAPTAWTATDGSGAGLTFATNADTRYVKSGKFCVISFMIQWPTTSDTHTAQINGIPAACTAFSGSFNWVAGGAVSLEVASISTELGRAAMQPGGTSLFMFGNGNQMTNANMSNGIVRGTITYITN